MNNLFEYDIDSPFKMRRVKREELLRRSFQKACHQAFRFLINKKRLGYKVKKNTNRSETTETVYCNFFYPPRGGYIRIRISGHEQKNRFVQNIMEPADINLVIASYAKLYYRVGNTISFNDFIVITKLLIIEKLEEKLLHYKIEKEEVDEIVLFPQE